MLWRTFTIVMLLLGIGAVGYGYFFYGAEQTDTDFAEQGTLVIDNPGLPQGVWHLVYEKPGAPARTATLIFDRNSRCATDDGLAPCVLNEGVLESGWHGKMARVSGVMQSQGKILVTALELVTETGTLVHVYYYHPAKDQGSGGAQCSREGLVALERVLPPENLIEETIRLLLRGELSDEERAEGITSEFPLPGVILADATLAGGILTLTFDDPQGRTGGGACRATIMRLQIEETAKQFAGVTSVRLVPDTLFQP